MHELANRLMRSAARLENGCLACHLNPSSKRPTVRLQETHLVVATRVVMASHLGRPIEPDEDVHHANCRTLRCIAPEHLAVISAAEHQAHHRADKRGTICPRHERPL